LSASRRDERWTARPIRSTPTQGIKYANGSRKFEVRRTSSQRRGLVVRPPGILAMNAWVADRIVVIDHKTSKSLEVTLAGENDQKTFKEVLSRRQHTASSPRKEGT